MIVKERGGEKTDERWGARETEIERDHYTLIYEVNSW